MDPKKRYKAQLEKIQSTLLTSLGWTLVQSLGDDGELRWVCPLDGWTYEQSHAVSLVVQGHR